MSPISVKAAAWRGSKKSSRPSDQRRGFRRPARNLVDEGQAIDAFSHPRWARAADVDDIGPAIVTAVERSRIAVRMGAESGDIDREGFEWMGPSDATRLVRPGDLVEARIVSRDEAATRVRAALEQEPQVEAALLAIDNRTGRILAMVGGYNFERSKFNRAVQAYRQLGSTFKAVVDSAAIDRGYTPVSILMDTPVSYSGGAGLPRYGQATPMGASKDPSRCAGQLRPRATSRPFA